MTGNRYWLALLLLLFTLPAAAQSRVVYQLGFGINQSADAFWPSGLKWTPALRSQNLPSSGPSIFAHQGYVGVDFLRDVTPRWALGVGAHALAGTWPLGHRNNLWWLNLITVEYRPLRSLVLRGSFGVADSYENKPAMGRVLGLQMVYTLTRRSGVGLGMVYGPVDQSAGNNLGGAVDKEGGQVNGFYLFFEWH